MRYPPEDGKWGQSSTSLVRVSQSLFTDHLNGAFSPSAQVNGLTGTALLFFYTGRDCGFSAAVSARLDTRELPGVSILYDEIVVPAEEEAVGSSLPLDVDFFSSVGGTWQIGAASQMTTNAYFKTKMVCGVYTGTQFRSPSAAYIEAVDPRHITLQDAERPITMHFETLNVGKPLVRRNAVTAPNQLFETSVQEIPITGIAMGFAKGCFSPLPTIVIPSFDSNYTVGYLQGFVQPFNLTSTVQSVEIVVTFYYALYVSGVMQISSASSTFQANSQFALGDTFFISVPPLFGFGQTVRYESQPRATFIGLTVVPSAPVSISFILAYGQPFDIAEKAVVRIEGCSANMPTFFESVDVALGAVRGPFNTQITDLMRRYPVGVDEMYYVRAQEKPVFTCS